MLQDQLTVHHILLIPTGQESTEPFEELDHASWWEAQERVFGGEKLRGQSL
jgi:hypothetical protein